MPKIVITAQSIAKAKAAAIPGAKQSELTDARAEGLCIRIGARGARWGLRFQLDGKQSRLDLGGIDDWSIAEARDIAAEAQRIMRSGLQRPDADWVHAQRIRLGKIEAPAAPELDPRLTLKWSFDDAKREFLDEVLRTRKPRTWEDYRSVLRTPELDRFAGKPLAAITLKQMSACIADIHRRGVERHAEHVASVIRPMWKWCGHLNRQDVSGLGSPRIMQDLEAPPRSRRVAPKKKYAPPLHEVGRMLAIARAGVFHPVISAGIELVILTAQRVNAVATAEKAHFVGIGDYSEGLWRMPPQHRKTAEKRGDEADHIVPLPPAAWAVVERMMEMHDDGDANPYLLRGQRPRRAGDTVGAIAPSGIQHAMMYSPGIAMTPHDMRRAFTTIGGTQFEWSLAQAKTILDHNEGRESGDITVLNYLWQGTHAKWPMMRNWVDLVEQAAVEAVEFDKRLQDVDWLKRYVVAERDAHKNGKRPPVSLTKGVKVVVPPMSPDPVAL